MDAGNPDHFASKEALKYWQDVDFYIGGTEHAVGHLLYSRFWHKFLFDLNFVPTVEPFKKLVNQGMIQARSNFVYRAKIDLAIHIFEEALKRLKIPYLTNTFVDGLEMDFVLKEYGILIDFKSIQHGNENAILQKYHSLMFDAAIEAVKNNGNIIKSKYLVIDFQFILSNISFGKRNIEYENQLVLDILENFKKSNIGFQMYFPPSIRTDVYLSREIVLQFPENCYTPIRVDVNLVENDFLDINKLRQNYDDFELSRFIYGSAYDCGFEVEKMSKSYRNVVNPDQICEDYGADTLRMYEMFLGPIEQSKPWNTNGITGVSGFLKKLWRICVGADGNIALTNEEPNAKELKTLHKTIKKIKEDIEGLSLNTSVSAFMICLNELSDLKCNKKAIYEPLLIILSPFAPHIAEELWSKMGHTTSIAEAKFPEFKPELLVENSFSYPVSFNGKHRFNLELPLGIPNEQIQETVLKHPDSSKWLEGKAPKKVIIVPGKIVNVVV